MNTSTQVTGRWIFAGLLFGLAMGGGPTVLILGVSVILMVFLGAYLVPLIVALGLDVALGHGHAVADVFGFPFTAMTLVLAFISVPLRRLLKF